MLDSMDKTELANSAIKLWRDVTGSLQHISNSANYIYSFIESGKTRYLRLTSSDDRALEQIEAELDFIAYLHRGRVSVMLPVPSAAGRFIEEIPYANKLLFGCVFEEAEGEWFRYDSAKLKKEHFI